MTEPAPSPIVDSDVGWVKKQIDEYIATDGKQPVFRYGSPLLLITVKGRKSGDWRRTCLIGASDGRYLAFSMVAAFAVCAAALAVVSWVNGGVRGVWAALVLLILTRLGLMGARFLRRRWLVTGFA